MPDELDAIDAELARVIAEWKAATAEEKAAIRASVDAAPPLTEAQTRRVGRLIRHAQSASGGNA